MQVMVKEIWLSALRSARAMSQTHIVIETTNVRDRQPSSKDSQSAKTRGSFGRWAIAIGVYLCFIAAICLTLMPSSWYWKLTSARNVREVEPSSSRLERAREASPNEQTDVLLLSEDAARSLAYGLTIS